MTYIKDEFGAKVLPFLKREELLVLTVCFVCFALGIPHITKVQYIRHFSGKHILRMCEELLFCHLSFHHREVSTCFS